MAMAGIAIIFNFYPEYKMGILFGILSAIGSALFPVFNKGFLKSYPPQTVMLYELGGGLLVLSLLLPFYLMLFPAAYFLPTRFDWGWLVVLALLCTVFTFHLQLFALKKISPFTANITYNLEPVYGIIMAFIFFKENQYLSGKFYLGLALILAAIGLHMALVFKKK
jgi:drug/metabolite transporter (DMT)-like permease